MHTLKIPIFPLGYPYGKSNRDYKKNTEVTKEFYKVACLGKFSYRKRFYNFEGVIDRYFLSQVGIQVNK